MVDAVTTHEIEVRKQQNINNVNNMKMYGVSETTINDVMYDAEIEEINSLEKAGAITPQEAEIRRMEAEKTRDTKNLNIMKRNGVSDTSINEERYGSELREINHMQKAGLISPEEAARERLDAQLRRDINNINIMKNSGMVSEATINSEIKQSQARYSEGLKQIESMRGEGSTSAQNNVVDLSVLSNLMSDWLEQIKEDTSVEIQTQASTN